MQTMKLGQIIAALEQFKPDSAVYFDFGYIKPTTLDSWRGVYSKLALGYELSMGEELMTEELLVRLRSANGDVFEGWKGGEYRMDLDTEVYVDNSGDYSKTIITGIVDDDGPVIQTAKING